ncbi:ribbon-helix-helix domain-containing protein [Candidatus Palauibacter sp.]|uniref:ribbon-helix-helix domain-containing protein n=1 Tax=Candidatus Palauibacter sp. TaxID=3101350 RepID=UPI003B011F75
MRITIRLDDDLTRAVKRHALETGTTVTAVIEQAVRERFGRFGPAPPRFRPAGTDVSRRGPLCRRITTRDQRLQDRTSHPPAPLALLTTGEGGLHPGVDLDASVALLELIEGGR